MSKSGSDCVIHAIQTTFCFAFVIIKTTEAFGRRMYAQYYKITPQNKMHHDDVAGGYRFPNEHIAYGEFDRIIFGKTLSGHRRNKGAEIANFV